ncbi:MAG: GGDEF domain-containing protein [Gammaproteobacteria bacterium]
MTGRVRAAPGLASVFALCSFLIAVVALVAYRLGLVDIIQPLAGGPALHPVTALSVILLAICVVLTMQRARVFIDGVCAVILLGALLRLAFPDETSRWLQQFNAHPGGPEAVVSTGTTFCLLMLAASLLLRQYSNAVISQIMSVLAYSAPALALVGFVLGVQEPHAEMSLTTVVMLILLCLATALRTVYRGILRPLLGPTRISTLARRHLALVMMAPYLLGLSIIDIDPSAAEISFVILIVASSQTVGLVVAFLALSFGNLERRSNILQRRAETRASRDGLTGAMNRASFTSHAHHKIGQHRSSNSNLSLLFIDADHFKRINDTYGHEAGDLVLKRIIRVTRGCLRNSDTVARWGGEEFVVLLPATDLKEALHIAEKIRHCIEGEHFDQVTTGLQVTVSIGCVEMTGCEGLDELVARADRALYAAKHRGRNQSVAA